MIIVLGGGLAGLSCSYHLGHQNCLILEKRCHAFGHVYSEVRDGYTWDQGPHVSFTKNDYVRDLFSDSANGEFEDYEVRTGNYFRGHWIEHPAQSSLYQVPEPLRSECLRSFLESRQRASDLPEPRNYAEWLDQAFGPVFARTFPTAYTYKYWTRGPQNLTTDWVGRRVFQPKVEEVVAGSRGPLGRQTHYITKVRYPRKGGYQAFANSLAAGARIRFGSTVDRIDLANCQVYTAAGEVFCYDRLINTLPLPVFVQLCAQVTPEIRDAARQLSCSQLLLVNLMAPHPTRRLENWMYVYDDDKVSTRINCTEKLTPKNAPPGSTGVQVEVYFSRHRPLPGSPAEIEQRVRTEVVEMGLIDAESEAAGKVKGFRTYAPWANVIFDHETRPALDLIWRWLEQYGLAREPDDLHPITSWSEKCDAGRGVVAMAGRFGQWKYFWTDDCVLRGRWLGEGWK